MIEKERGKGTMMTIGFLKRLAVLAILWAGLPSLSVRAEPLDYYLVDGVTYDQTVLKPSAVFGHDIGDQPIRHDLMVSYLRQLAAASPRMSVETIGYSHEKRPILFLVVTHPDNHARIDDIRTQHLLRTDPSTAGQASGDLPVVTWINYGVHGAEASGMDAAVPALYHLAAAQGTEIERTLRESVILITAIFNPDGHSRRAGWVTSYGSNVITTDPGSEIHNHMWPGGRTNHYWFDLNRQWLLQTQPESQAWLKAWHKWKPQVSADFHEMGPESTYYFHPGVPTRKNPRIPAEARELLVDIADYHAGFMDAEKKLYFTEEGFDNYYIGKGSTYPQVNGGVGILFEAGAQMGIVRESDQGLKTYANNIRVHFRTSLTTIEGARAMRARLHAYQARFFASVPDLARDDRETAYVVAAPEDPTRLAKFAEFLGRHDIRAYSLDRDVRADGRTFGAGGLIVPLNQPQYRLIKAMFERRTEFPDRVFYDVSGWTLPLAYGLDYAALRGRIGVPLDTPAPTRPPRADMPDRAPYAYILRWSDYYAPRAVNRLLSAGVLVRTALNPITVETTTGPTAFERGAIIVSLDRQTVSEEAIYSLMTEIAEEDGLTVHMATSGRTPTPGSDLGGRNSVRDLHAPHPLIVVGDGFSAYDAGEIWHLLDKRMEIGATLVRQSRLKSVDWNRYSHLILPGGRAAKLPKDIEKSVTRWIRGGGTLIAQRQSAVWAAKTLFAPEKKADKDGKKTEAPVRLTYADKGQNDAEHIIGGAVFESRLDMSHPLGFGIVRPLLASNKNTVQPLPVPKDPYGQVAVYSDAPLLSGYASDRRVGEIKGTPMLTAERVGDGAVILFADNPNFRATYLGTEKLFLNAIFFSTAFDRARTAEDAGAEHQH